MKTNHLYLLPASKKFWPVRSMEVRMMEHIFDHVPDTAFFIKDLNGKYTAINQSLVERCGLNKKEQLLGRNVFQIFPKELAKVYSEEDQKVIRTGRPIVDCLEMHWYWQRKPGWCLTTKLPIFSPEKKVVGIVGVSRDLAGLGRSKSIPPGLAKAMKYLETHYQDPITPGILARQAELSNTRFARLIKWIFHLTPNQLILQTRLTAAAQRLTDTDESISEIAYACGFYDHSALTRSFRSVTTLTPTQFRNDHRQRPETEVQSLGKEKWRKNCLKKRPRG